MQLQTQEMRKDSLFGVWQLEVSMLCCFLYCIFLS